MSEITVWRIEIPDKNLRLKVGLGPCLTHLHENIDEWDQYLIEEQKHHFLNFFDQQRIGPPCLHSSYTSDMVCFFADREAVMDFFRRKKRYISPLGFRVVEYTFPHKELHWVEGQFIARHDAFTSQRVLKGKESLI